MVCVMYVQADVRAAPQLVSDACQDSRKTVETVGQ